MVMTARSKLYRLIYAPQVKEHLRQLGTRYLAAIRRGIEEQLTHQPEVETLNRKPLKQPVSFEAQWELRLGPGNRFRIFYEIDRRNREVHILAIGIKRGNRLIIGGEEIDL
jgi:mRNA-degrading endonuclease RelE of RelBE toxin-antitoxin system